MEKGDRRLGGPEQMAGDRESTREPRPAPGKVTRTSKLWPGRELGVQRKTAATGIEVSSTQPRSLWDLTTDPWMDAAHRGTTALVEQSQGMVDGNAASENGAEEADDEAGSDSAFDSDVGATGGDGSPPMGAAGEIEGQATGESAVQNQSQETEGEGKGARDAAARALEIAMTGRQGPLPHAQEMTARFSADLSRLRCFFGPEAERACAMIGAEAFAVGNIIVFARDSPSVALVAHEVAHVLQQGGDQEGRTLPSAPSGLDMSTPGDESERDADRAAAGDAPPEVTADRPILSRYLATKAPGVWLVSNPSRYRRTLIRKLPRGTRVTIIDRGDSEPFNQITDSYRWVKVRVTAGSGRGLTGWVMKAFLHHGQPSRRRRRPRNQPRQPRRPPCHRQPRPRRPTIDPLIRAAAAALVDIGGTAGEADRQLVIAEMVKLPVSGMHVLAATNARVVVCRNSVTEIRTDLRGVRPRGWPPGSTWDSVPGLYDPSSRRAIIATRNGRIPPSGEDHGSSNLVLHEVGHAIDHAAGGGSATAEFQRARNADLQALSDYERQQGTAGLEETYAESLARFYNNDPNDAARFPNLHAYWASDPLARVMRAHGP